MLSFSQVEKAVFVIVKLSYNNSGEASIVGGICGSAFLIDDSTVITAHHVLNSQVEPNSGYRHCQFWLLNRDNNLVIPIESKDFEDHKEIEATIIHLQTALPDYPHLEIEKNDIKLQDDVYSIGHVGDIMPVKDAEWKDNILVIKSFSLDSCHADNYGQILEIKKATITANDINIKDLEVIRLSFGAILGMSGGPLLNKKTNKLIGLMSFGFPADSAKKEIVFAISVNELSKNFHK